MATGTTEPTEAAHQALIDVLQRECATTLKVLRAYPPDQAELRPHELCKTARELAFMFTAEMKLATAALKDALDMSKGFPEPPATFGETVKAFESASTELLDALRRSDLSGTVRFFTGPGTMGDYAKPDFLWFLLHDQIHHRGQFSIYLRMAGGKVPSIYGPTADEPWT